MKDRRQKTGEKYGEYPRSLAEMAGVSLSTASIVANGKAKERKIFRGDAEKGAGDDEGAELHSECISKNAPAGRVTEVCRCVLSWNFDFRRHYACIVFCLDSRRK